MRSDLDLLEAWRANDQSAGEELFARYYPLLLRFFANKVPVEPTDLIQETMLACVDGQHRLRETEKFRAFLFSIAYNKLRDFYRRAQVGEEPVDMASHASADLAPGPSTMMGRDEQQQLMLRALRRIPVEYQVLLELFYWEDATSAEISVLMDVPHSTIRTRIRRARQLLEEALAESANDPRVLERTRTDLDGWAAKIRSAHQVSAAL
ncbi:MAG: sigma-70 family RNA polymerase sigma factor [Myxococcota bacterium]